MSPGSCPGPLTQVALGHHMSGMQRDCPEHIGSERLPVENSVHVFTSG